MTTRTLRNWIAGTAAVAVVAVSVGIAGAAHHGDEEKKKDIVDTAVAAGSFKTLVAAVQAAELVDVLKGEGPFTVFAPTDEAFAKLPEGTVETLLKPENRAKLQMILKYHVVAGRVSAETVVASRTLNTVAGQAAAITVREGVAKIDNATITATDIEAANGLIHVIDHVILPKE